MKKYEVLFCDMDGTLIETVSRERRSRRVYGT